VHSQPEMLKLKRRIAGHMDQDGLTEMGRGIVMIVLGFFYRTSGSSGSPSFCVCL